MWIKEMHYRDELKHTIEYQFVCQSCNIPSGAVKREITAIHERKYPGHFALSPEDQVALPVILQNKLSNVLLLTWIAFERGEYNYIPGTSYTKEDLVNYSVNQWIAKCPHCGEEQRWVPKKKLFGKPKQVDPAYLPKINWHWEILSINMPQRIEQIKQVQPRYITDKQYFALSGSELGIRFSMVNDDEKMWQYVVPGLHFELVKDLMDEDNPPYYVVNPTSLSYDASLPKDRPELNKGESCYGFIDSFESGDVTRWAMSRNGKVVRTQVMSAKQLVAKETYKVVEDLDSVEKEIQSLEECSLEQLYELLLTRTPDVDLHEAQSLFVNMIVAGDPKILPIAAPEAVAVIDDVDHLQILATKTHRYAVCSIQKLSDQEHLINVALHCRSSDAIEAALQKLNLRSLQKVISEARLSGRKKDVEELAEQLISGYICVVCHASNLPDENGLPSCSCSSCGHEQHDYREKSGKQRLRSDETLILEWDECIRCGAIGDERTYAADA